MSSYTMYHCHSDYSLLDSCTKYQDYIDLAVENGSKALSISEHGQEKYLTGQKNGMPVRKQELDIFILLKYISPKAWMKKFVITITPY